MPKNEMCQFETSATASRSIMRTRLLALDWGTSSLRAHRLGAGGSVIETRQLALGVAHISRSSGEERARAFAAAFEQACGDWVLAHPGAPAIACGMVGSAQGWREAPYVEIPADAGALAGALTAVVTDGGATLHIVPGLRERGRLPNVMRGEETQIAGALDELGGLAGLAPDAASGAPILVGLPGTHSKWAQVGAGRVLQFDTFMTGEVYDALCGHTLLGRTLRRGGDRDLAAFDRGARVARSPEGRAGVLSTIFSARTLGLAGELSPEGQADYLSGLLIGHEIQALEDLDRHALDGAARIVLAGEGELCARYRRVLAGCGHRGVALARAAAERGLWSLARAAGLVADSPEDARAGGSLRAALGRCGLVAILRGIRPEEARAVGEALYAAGLRAIEVPLNSPDPLASIRALRESLASDCAVGAGTVLDPAAVEDVRRAGGDFVVTPHADLAVVRAARAAGLEVAPGAATATEAIAALAAGADLIKMFPAAELGAGTLAAWRAVLPAGSQVIAVGGVTTDNLAELAAAGAAGFGIGSAIYRPGLGAGEVAARAAGFVAAWRATCTTITV
ncbi:MAG TPA: 2-dehydro-3-deoxy-6-phosphogalactonate aldolase [Kofleriaceae bacterium]|nr:2-dehydro-3-deoxy-6-phosphogalactonate aldolase [Kofleriaceae bacterium]